MAGIPLSGTPFRDILPESVRDDPQLTAAASSLDALFAEGDAETKQALIWSRIKESGEQLLSNLAYQLHLDGYEGWGLAETLEQKRALVQNAIILHFHKGTPYSLKRVFELLDMRGYVTEWWESGESEEDFPPYTFDMEIEGTRSIDATFTDNVMGLIHELKNERSHLRKLRIAMLSSGRFNVASVMHGGIILTMQPFKEREVETSARLPFAASTFQTLHHIAIYPWETP